MTQTIENQLVTAHCKQFRPMISAEEIAAKVAEIGASITEKYAGKKPLLLSILNGAFMFAADLSRAIDTPQRCDECALSGLRRLLRSHRAARLRIRLRRSGRDNHSCVIRYR